MEAPIGFGAPSQEHLCGTKLPIVQPPTLAIVGIIDKVHATVPNFTRWELGASRRSGLFMGAIMKSKFL
jgi:hypothetical protein